jgi:hypothetical protein
MPAAAMGQALFFVIASESARRIAPAALTSCALHNNTGPIRVLHCAFSAQLRRPLRTSSNSSKYPLNSHISICAKASKTAFHCWGCGSDAAGRLSRIGNTPPFPQSPPKALHLRQAFHQQAADELGHYRLGGAGDEGLGEGREVLGGVVGAGVTRRVSPV